MMASPGARARVVGAVLLLLVFIAGIAVGVAIERVAHPEPRIKTVFVGEMGGVLDKLGLTPQQRARADSIIERRAPATETMMLDVADRLRAISDSLDDEMRSILTPPQSARLDSLRSDRKLLLRRKMITR